MSNIQRMTYSEFLKNFSTESDILLIAPKMFEKMEDSNFVLAGGALRSVFDNTEIDDFDWFTNRKEDIQLVSEDLEEIGAVVKFRCPEGEIISLELDGIKHQLIYQNYKTNKELIRLFDFSCISCYLDKNLDFFFLPGMIESALTKKLVVNKITYPVSTMRRVEKYIRKGYTANAEFYATLLRDAIEINKEADLSELIERSENNLDFYHNKGPWGASSID